MRPGGHVANVGVHGKPVELPLQDLWIHNITISMGLVNTNTTPMLLRLIAEGRLDVDKFVSHHFKLDEMLAAYDTFGRAAETKALKVIIDVDRLAVRIRDDLQPRRDVDHFQVTMKIGCKWRG